MARNSKSDPFSESCIELECADLDPRMIAAEGKMDGWPCWKAPAARTIDLTSYEIIVMNTSAGKDSQAAMQRLVEVATEQGVMDRITVVHCDLGRSEWQGVRELAVRQAEAYGLPVRVVSRQERGGNDLLDQVEHERHAWPAIGLAQFCTSDHKTSQAGTVVTELIGDLREAEGFKRGSTKRHVRVLQVLGLRAQESSRRAAKLPVENRKTNASKTEDEWLPIFDWTTERVWECIRSNGLESHPAYELGMSRLSCCFCVVAKLEDLQISGRANKDLLAEYVRVERRVDAWQRANVQAVELWDARIGESPRKAITGHTFKQGWSLESLWTELYPHEDVDAPSETPAACTRWDIPRSCGRGVGPRQAA
jgi:3'-phosphoadenosine 5'-phosphosulfate sulfotransferase (PAPS reductase)/FAD synthetase